MDHASTSEHLYLEEEYFAFHSFFLTIKHGQFPSHGLAFPDALSNSIGKKTTASTSSQRRGRQTIFHLNPNHTLALHNTETTSVQSWVSRSRHSLSNSLPQCRTDRRLVHCLLRRGGVLTHNLSFVIKDDRMDPLATKPLI